LAATVGIEHATESFLIVSRLILLLRSNVNIPPNWVVDLNVLVQDVGNYSSLSRIQVLCLVAIWILLDINSFEGSVESHIMECNVVYASEVTSGGNRADCHTYSVFYLDIAHVDIFSALRVIASFVHGLHSDGIVEVCNLDALDKDVLSRRVDAVSVEGKRWEF